MAGFPTVQGLWPWPWIGSHCIPSCSTHRPLPTSQISLKSKTFYGRMDVSMDGRTFETGFIRSTLSKSRPKKQTCNSKSQDTITSNIHKKHYSQVWLPCTTSSLKNNSLSLLKQHITTKPNQHLHRIYELKGVTNNRGHRPLLSQKSVTTLLPLTLPNADWLSWSYHLHTIPSYLWGGSIMAPSAEATKPGPLRNPILTALVSTYLSFWQTSVK